MSTLAGVYQSTKTGHDCPLRTVRPSTMRLIDACSGSRYSLYFRLQMSKHSFYIGIRQSFDDSCRVAFRINLQIVLECGSMGADIFRVQLDVLLSWCHGQPLVRMITINATIAARACMVKAPYTACGMPHRFRPYRKAGHRRRSLRGHRPARIPVQ